MRFRYSLRTLWIGVTLLAVGIGWLGLPSLRAWSFVSAMERDDYAAAERLFTDRQRVFPGPWKDEDLFHPRVILKPLSWQDMLCRRRQMVVAVSYCDCSGMASCAVEIEARAEGLALGMAIP